MNAKARAQICPSDAPRCPLINRHSQRDIRPSAPIRVPFRGSFEVVKRAIGFRSRVEACFFYAVATVTPP